MASSSSTRRLDFEANIHKMTRTATKYEAASLKAAFEDELRLAQKHVNKSHLKALLRGGANTLRWARGTLPGVAPIPLSALLDLTRSVHDLRRKFWEHDLWDACVSNVTRYVEQACGVSPGAPLIADIYDVFIIQARLAALAKVKDLTALYPLHVAATILSKIYGSGRALYAPDVYLHMRQFYYRHHGVNNKIDVELVHYLLDHPSPAAEDDLLDLQSA